MRLAVFILWLIHWLPFPIVARIGKLFGTLAYHILDKRREIALINLRVCFPESSEAERQKLAKQHFQAYGRSVVERGILWWAPVRRIEKLIEVTPALPVEEMEAGPVIYICPHFVCLEVPGAAITMHWPGSSIYTKQVNPLIDRLLRHSRMRFNPENVVLFSRQEGIKPIIRTLRRNIPFYMLPDMDFGIKDAEFIPFFGEPAATLVAPARLAAVTGAKVIPVIPTFLPDYKGWKVEFYPPLENFPGDDMTAATKRLNAFIEERIVEHPAEYLWTHRRFKTRPQGMPPLYKRRNKKKKK